MLVAFISINSVPLTVTTPFANDNDVNKPHVPAEEDVV